MTETLSTPSSQASSISETSSTRYDALAPASRATSTSRTELEELAEPTTISRSTVLGDVLDRELAVLGGVADVVAGRVEEQRETLPDRGHRLERLVDRQRRLGEPGDTGRVAYDDPGDVGRALHELDVVRRLARRALHLLVALVADQEDVVVVGGEALRLVVDLGHQRAGGVDRLELALLGLAMHLGRDAVGGEHDGGALRHLLDLLHEDRTARLEIGHDVLVVHDLLADVDR